MWPSDKTLPPARRRMASRKAVKSSTVWKPTRYGSDWMHGAFRRSELVALDVADIAETETGLLVTIRRSKTDQDGEGVTIAIARGDVACPARALREWLDAAGIEAGPIFKPINKAGTVSGERLTDRSVGNIVNAYAGEVG